MNIGLITSGGDAPGMNAFISKFVSLATQERFSVFAFKCGYQGLVDNNMIRLTEKDVANIAHLGGSHIKSFRSGEFITKTGFQKSLETLKTNKIDALIVLGGDGTFNGAKELCKHGIKTIFVPSTIDNDLIYTQQTLGFDSAVNTAVDSIDKIKQTMLSLNRIFICEVMGRHCADIAINCAIATDATLLITDKKFPFEEIIKALKTALTNGEEAPSIIVKENILNVYKLAKDIQNELDIETRASIIGYIQRGTQPSVSDRIYARELAKLSIDYIKVKKFNKALGKINNTLASIDL